MMKRLLLLLVAACGDNSDPPAGETAPDAGVPLIATCDEAKLVETLRAVPHVANVTTSPCGDYVEGAVQCFKIEFTQPIQHAAPTGKQFGQALWLMHRGCDRPTLVADWGYSQDFFYDDELVTLYQSNAIWIEHRFQGVSLPAAAADWDWTALTIENGAHDMHEIIQAFRTFYGKNFVSTGASKGGITATYHHYFHPDDLDGTIPYVAPGSRARNDPGYQAFLTTKFPPCAQQVRDAQVAALTTRKTAMLTRLTDVAPGFEEYILGAITATFDWGFWQYWGVGYCNRVPTAATSDDAFFQFFYQFSGLGGIATPAFGTPDADLSNGALYYEWLTEQGFAVQHGDHVRPYLDADNLRTLKELFEEQFPDVALPAYNGSVTYAVRAWARDHGKDTLFIYGQFDPWSGGAIDAPKHPSSARYFVPNATHGAQLVRLPPAQRDEALAMASRFFGASPVMPLLAKAERAGARRVQITDDQVRHLATQIARRRMRR